MVEPAEVDEDLETEITSYVSLSPLSFDNYLHVLSPFDSFFFNQNRTLYQFLSTYVLIMVTPSAITERCPSTALSKRLLFLKRRMLVAKLK